MPRPTMLETLDQMTLRRSCQVPLYPNIGFENEIHIRPDEENRGTRFDMIATVRAIQTISDRARESNEMPIGMVEQHLRRTIKQVVYADVIVFIDTYLKSHAFQRGDAILNELLDSLRVMLTK